jgi:hypothetical protein
MGYRYLKIKVYTKIILLWQFQNICIPKNGETQNNIALIFKNNHSKINLLFSVAVLAALKEGL